MKRTLLAIAIMLIGFGYLLSNQKKEPEVKPPEFHFTKPSSTEEIRKPTSYFTPSKPLPPLGQTLEPMPTAKGAPRENGIRATSDSEFKEKTKRSQVYQRSEGWEFLQNPRAVYPGAKFSVEDGACSTGWIVRSKKEPQRHLMLTAGHCTEKVGETVHMVYEGTEHLIGQTVWTTGWNGAGGADWALVELTTNSVDSSLPWEGPQIKGWVGNDWIERNKPYICRLGWRTGLSCGSYIEMQNNYTLRYEGLQDHGDSGGPVWAYDNKTGDWYAVAVTSFGEDDDAVNSGAVTIAQVMNEFNLEIL